MTRHKSEKKRHRKTAKGYVQLFFRYADPITGKAHSKTVYGRTEQEAADKKAAFLADISDGLRVTDGGMTVAQWAESWLNLYKRPFVTASTLRGYECHIKTINSVIGGIALRSLTQAHIMSVYAALADKSASTIHHVKTLLRSMLKAAVENKFILSNPAKEIKPPKGAAGTHRAIGMDEMNAIIAVAKGGHRYANVILLMLFCGLRRGEACAITDADISADAKTVTVSKAVTWLNNTPTLSPPKSKAGNRVVPIPAAVQPYLRLNGYATGGDTITTLTAFRRGYSSFMTAVAETMHGYTKRWRRGRPWKDCDIRPHDLRHTYATLLYDAGVDIKAAQKWLGHTSPEFTMRLYTHLTETRKAKSSDRLSNFIESKVQSKVQSKCAEYHTTINEPKTKNRQKLNVFNGSGGAPSGTRTRDTLIKSQVLYQLS